MDESIKLNETSEKCMMFYHGTSKENWDAIQKEGIL